MSSAAPAVRHAPGVTLSAGSPGPVLSDRMPVGVCYTTFHHPVTGANVITTENSDRATNCPEYKVTAVQVALTPEQAPVQEKPATRPVTTRERAPA